MRITTAAAVCALAGLVVAQQQDNNSTQQQDNNNNTIFHILNNTDGSSPSSQIMHYLQSSPDYESIVNILNDPNNNVTFFVPSDEVFYNITGQQPPATTNGTMGNNGTTAGNSTTGNNMTSTYSSSSLMVATSGISQPATTSTFGFSDLLSMIQASPTAAPTATSQSQARYVKIPLANGDGSEDSERFVLNEPSNGNLVMRALKGSYHLHNRQEQPQQNNATIDALTTSPYYMEFTPLDLAYYHLVNGSVTLNESTVILNSLLTNSTVNKFGSGSPLLVQPGNDSSVLTVGDGYGNNATINQTIQAGNGIIYVINKILIPPVNTTQTIDQVQNASTFNQLLEQSNSTAEALDAASNFTLFIPVNDALQNLSTSTLDNQTLMNIFQAHVFPGVYYSTNLTTDQNVTIESTAGTNVTLQKDPNTGAVTVNGTNVVQANILTNNGVIHLIDSILGFPTVAAPGANPSENPSGEGPFPSPTNMPSSSVITAAIPNLVSAGAMLSATFVVYFVFA